MAADNSLPNSPVDVLLVTTTEIEQQNVLERAAQATGHAPIPMRSGEVRYWSIGKIAGSRVVMVRTNMGSATPGGSQTIVKAAVDALFPRYVIAVGLAFGLKVEGIGTILLSDRLALYEPQKLGTNQAGERYEIPRGDIITAGDDITALFRQVATSLPVERGLMVSSEKLIDNVAFRTAMQAEYPEAIGGEMEAAGIYVACRNTAIQWLVVKAVCDLADGNKSANKEQNQRLAAANATQFVFEALSAGFFSRPDQPRPADNRPTIVLRMNPGTKILVPPGVSPSMTYMVATPPGAWQHSSSSDCEAWPQVVAEIKRVTNEIGQEAAAQIRFVGYSPYSLGTILANRLLVQRQHSLTIDQYQDRPDGGGSEWTVWPENTQVGPSILTIERDPALHDTIVDLQLHVEITRRIKSEEIPPVLQSTAQVTMTLPNPGTVSIENAQQARTAALQLEELLFSLCEDYPRATLHLFYTGPLGIIMLASRRLHLLSRPGDRARLIVYELYKASSVTGYWPAVSWPAGTLYQPIRDTTEPPAREHTSSAAEAKITPWDESLQADNFTICSSTFGDAETQALLRNVEQLGICLFRMDGQSPDDSMLRQLEHLIGPATPRQNQFVGKIKNIIPNKSGAMGSGDNSDNLGLHVDGTQHTLTPRLLGFLYVTAAKLGANSLFVDVARVLEDMPRADRWRIVSTLSHPSAAQYNKSGLDYEGPVFFPNGPHTLGIRVRFDEVISIRSGCKEAFEELKAACEDPKYQLWLQPREGDLIVFDNHRLVHGRDRVRGQRVREHWRMWIEKLKPSLSPNYQLGLRPISSELLSEVRLRNGTNGAKNGRN